MLFTDESDSSSNTNEWINQDIQWFQARSNHRRKKLQQTLQRQDNSNTWSIYFSSSIKQSPLPNEFQFQLFISLREVDFFGK